MTTKQSQPAIAVTGLRKSFGDQVVLDGIDLIVPQGTVFSLLGANGAGKTTTVKILSTLISADAGDVRVAGHDLASEPDAVRAAIGVTGQFSAVDNLLTGRENLLLMADLHHIARGEGRRRADQLLEQFDLVEAAGKPVLTTQYLEEADELADRIAVLDHGRLVAEGTADELKRRIPGGHVRLRFADPRGLDAAAHLLGPVSRDNDALALRVPSDGSLRSLKTLIDRLEDQAIEVDELSVHTPDLDDVFLALTGDSTNEKVTTR